LTGRRRPRPGRVLLAWLAGALLLLGLPGAASAAGAPTAVRSTAAASHVAKATVQRVAQGGRGELTRSDASRGELVRSTGSGHAGSLAEPAAEPPTYAPVAGAALAGERTRVLDTGAPADLRGRAPPAAGSPRFAGLHSA
jgi:hypothetical protein